MWIAYCVQLGLSKDYKGITHSPPMNNYEPEAEKRKHVQNNPKKDELSQPKAVSLHDSLPGFGDHSKLGFLCLKERWIHGREGRWEKTGNALGPWCPWQLGSSEPREEHLKGTP